MSKTDKTLAKLLSGQHDANLGFADLCALLTKLRFEMRQTGSHHIFRRQGFDMLNLQPAGQQAKPYQVRQIREALRKGGM